MPSLVDLTSAAGLDHKKKPPCASNQPTSVRPQIINAWPLLIKGNSGWRSWSWW